MDRPIKILFLAANPKDTSQLKLDEEMRAIDQAIRQSEFRDRFDIKQQWAVRVTDLQGYLLRHKPDIVHFSGHGSTLSEIVLENNSGNSQPVPSHALSQLFSMLKDNIRCVILNACYSEQQARAIAEHIECVIGMSEAIGDSAAISFATAFYQALGYGRNVKTAFDLGRVQIDLENLNEQDTPKLLASDTNPEEIVFVHELPSTINTLPSTSNIASQQLFGDTFRVTDHSAQLVIDAMGFGVSHEGICVGQSDMPWWNSKKNNFAPTLSIALSNPGSKDIVLVPKIEVLKRATFPSKDCTFPNDPTIGAMIQYFEKSVDLEDNQLLSNILPSPMQLQPLETFSLMLAFTGRLNICYRIQFRVYWKIVGKNSGMTTLSETYLINFATDKTTWQDQIKETITRGEFVWTRLAYGHGTFNKFLETLNLNTKMFHICKIERNSKLEEFILLGNTTVIVPEIPPKDRYIEISATNRRGIFMASPEMASKYKIAYETLTNVR